MEVLSGPERAALKEAGTAAGANSVGQSGSLRAWRESRRAGQPPIPLGVSMRVRREAGNAQGSQLAVASVFQCLCPG